MTPPQAPRIFAKTTARGVPLIALLVTSSVSAICFCASSVGSGILWGWLQNIVGVSNQVRYSLNPRIRRSETFSDSVVLDWYRKLEIPNSLD
jgi:hypothetical protein